MRIRLLLASFFIASYPFMLFNKTFHSQTLLSISPEMILRLDRFYKFAEYWKNDACHLAKLVTLWNSLHIHESYTTRAGIIIGNVALFWHTELQWNIFHLLNSIFFSERKKLEPLFATMMILYARYNIFNSPSIFPRWNNNDGVNVLCVCVFVCDPFGTVCSNFLHFEHCKMNVQ